MPKIYVRGQLLAHTGNTTGVYHDVAGKPMFIDTNRVDEAREILIWHPELAGREGRSTEHGLRRIELSRRGTGAQVLAERGLVRVDLEASLVERVIQRGRPTRFVPSHAWRK